MRAVAAKATNERVLTDPALVELKIQMHTLDAPTELVNDGRLLASCGDDGAIQIWRMETGDLVATLRRDRPYERLDITDIEGVTDGQKLALKLMGAVEHLSSDATVINTR